MIFVIGLGNPGKEYQYTRHNIGFIAVDKLAKQYNLSFNVKKKFNADIAEGNVGTYKLLLIKPMTYMNLSGNAVSAIKSYYNIKLENIYVIHDDIDLAVGRIKYKQGGGNGGHNGLKSLDQTIGNNYHRIRIGISRPENSEEVADYVLHNFFKAEYNIIEQAINKITNNFDLLLEGKLEEFKNKVI
ncbi:aminoacyl-tRNA hydrolase [Rickettsia endosymbiont of Halotydeus destructor]|uniref:aminoacyl-tRNA hydrolase n=1 Tax=Rickettsia endosymbiont of Halotydeus destructor TaxID=2996754 RepID=UPI003BAE3F3E